MLDDFHRLSSGPARESVAWFVDHLPATVQLVLATRTDPALPLGTLRARGQLLELRADELRFTPPEADEFLNDRLGARARRRRRRAARRAHRGLARRHLPGGAVAGRRRRQARPGDGVRRHERARRRLPRRARCSPPTSRSCRRSCCARRCSSGCARRCATRSWSAADRPPRSSRSRARTCSCSRSTTAAAWFRFHHLFAQILRVELERREPELVPELHRRAFEWHSEYGTTDEAIHHAVAARAFAEAGAADRGDAGSTTPTPAGPRRSTTGCRGFPAAVLDADPRLLLVKAWVSALRGREDEMRAAVGAGARARRAGRRAAAGRLRLARVEPLGAAARRSAGATCRRSSSTARARRSSRARSRRGAR